MSLLNRTVSRRSFLRMGVQLPIFVFGFRTKSLTAVGLLQTNTCSGTAYGIDIYGRGCYGGYCVPTGDVFPDVPDGLVDIQDITAIATHWRLRDGDPDWDSRFNLDEDGGITVGDLMVAVTHWGEECP